MPNEEPKKKPRGKRRNFAKVVADLETYCKLSIEIIGDETTNEFSKGQIFTFRKILTQIGAAE